MVRGFSVLRDVQTGFGVHPTSYSMGTGFLSGGLEWLGLVINHLPPSSAEVKSEWHYTCSNYVFMACTETTVCFQEESAIYRE